MTRVPTLIPSTLPLRRQPPPPAGGGTTGGGTSGGGGGSSGGGGGGGGVGKVTDFTAPDSPSGFTVTGADKQINLTWSNPTSADFVRVLILRSTKPIITDSVDNRNPRAISDTTVVYDGDGEEFTDTNLSDST